MPFLTILEIDVSHIEVLGALFIFVHGNRRRSVPGGVGGGGGGMGGGMGDALQIDVMLA
jgi:hypothetical protein